MIISASYKTDIPAFYGEWFLNRLRAGYAKVVNPYSGQLFQVSLARPDVDGFVFWTKNLGPFLPRLRDVHDAGHAFVVQYAINGYPRELETSVVDAARAVDHAREVAEIYGPRVVVWRYDTIVFSRLTPYEFHLDNFSRLAEALRGTTDEVVVSYMQVYQKTRRNLNLVEGLGWHDPEADEKRRLNAELTSIARDAGIQLTVCSQRDFVTPGAAEARCIDRQRLEDVAGHPIKAKLKGNRPECACYESRDIGDYDTCPHGCVYCYAVRSRSLARARHHRHDPTAEML